MRLWKRSVHTHPTATAVGPRARAAKARVAAGGKLFSNNWFGTADDGRRQFFSPAEHRQFNLVRDVEKHRIRPVPFF